jgi:hypothetical protein
VIKIKIKVKKEKKTAAKKILRALESFLGNMIALS